MFAQMARDVETILRDREYPIRVLYGPQRFDVEGPQMQVRVERDRTTPDEYGAAPGPRSNDSRPIAQRSVSLVWSLYTRSSVVGATAREEEALIDQLVDALYVALYEWGKSARTLVSVGNARMMTAEERGVEAISTGEGYTMQVVIPRGIMSLNYRGEGRPTATPTEVGAGQIKVSLDGTNYEDV